MRHKVYATYVEGFNPALVAHSETLARLTLGATKKYEFMANFRGTYVKLADADDPSFIKQRPNESVRKFWTLFLKKKNEIVDCSDAEAFVAFRNNINDEWLPRDCGHYKMKTMAALIVMMNKFCNGEDNSLAKRRTNAMT